MLSNMEIICHFTNKIILLYSVTDFRKRAFAPIFIILSFPSFKFQALYHGLFPALTERERSAWSKSQLNPCPSAEAEAQAPVPRLSRNHRPGTGGFSLGSLQTHCKRHIFAPFFPHINLFSKERVFSWEVPEQFHPYHPVLRSCRPPREPRLAAPTVSAIKCPLIKHMPRGHPGAEACVCSRAEVPASLAAKQTTSFPGRSGAASKQVGRTSPQHQRPCFPRV